MEKPSLEKPSPEKPSLEEPSLEEPSLEEPSLEEPSLEEPSLEEPSLEKPGPGCQVRKAEPDRRETKIVLGHAGSRMSITGRKCGRSGTETNTGVARA
jgi:hypothetical protein